MTDQTAPEAGSRGRARRVGLVVALVAGAGLLAIVLSSRGAKGAKEKGPRAETVPVSTALATRKTVPVQIRAIGTVEAYNAVAVRSLVAGELVKIHFKQGQEVKRGDLLFTVDTRPLESAAQQAEATLARDMAAEKQAEAIVARDRAQAKYADAEAKRHDALFAEGIESRELSEQYRAGAEASAAVVAADEATVLTMKANVLSSTAAASNARVQLSYAVIRAPIDGKTGNLTVYEGNLVKANDTTPLVTLTQAMPIYVAFSLPEQDLGRLNAAAAAHPVTVSASLPGDDAHTDQGSLSFVDNAVDATTGTIRLKATFPNAGKRLWPGQFARVTIDLASQRDATVVPSQAIQIGQDGPYVYVVKDDATVEPRPVKVGATVEPITVVLGGIEPGEAVVTDGQLRLFPGAHIEKKGDAPGDSKGEPGGEPRSGKGKGGNRKG